MSKVYIAHGYSSASPRACAGARSRAAAVRPCLGCASVPPRHPRTTSVIPAKAGTQTGLAVSFSAGRNSHMGSRLRGNDEEEKRE
jgi:hypothetical protein